jgi:hypothetical protein
MSRLKRRALLAALITGIMTGAFAEGFFLDIGPSINISTYPWGSTVDHFIANYRNFYALDRFGYGFSVGGGYQIVQGLYVSGTLIYTLDWIHGSGYEFNFHQPALLAGLRWYPLRGKRYLQLGLEAGPAWLVFENNIAHPGYEDQSAIGLGVNLSAALDFNTGFTGPHWMLWANILYSYINGGSVVTPSIAVKMAYKHSKNVPAEEDLHIDEMSLAAGIVVPLITAVATLITIDLIPSMAKK